MITQSMFHELQELLIHLTTDASSELIRFVHPYILVIHLPTGRGFYLDRDYKHIIDIKNCQEPDRFVEVSRNCLHMGSHLPSWAKKENYKEFDVFWL